MHNVISALTPEVKKQVVGGVLWGDTKNKQSNGQIIGYPKDQVLILCTPDDGVCWGKLDVTAGHLAYTHNGDEAKSVTWLKGKIDAAIAAKGAQPTVPPVSLPALSPAPPLEAPPVAPLAAPTGRMLIMSAFNG